MARSKAAKIFLGNLGSENPVFMQVLGICSTLAVTNKVANTFVMCMGLIFTLALSNITLSIIRKQIPARVRMMVEVLIIATYVIVVDIILKAAFPSISQQLGPYVGLIITNCIIMGRAEAFALGNPPGLSLVDGLSSGIGYSYVLLIIAIPRELLGAGSICGIQLLGRGNIFNSALLDGWVNWSIMVMAPGAFFVLAIFIWIVKSRVNITHKCCKGDAKS